MQDYFYLQHWSNMLVQRAHETMVLGANSKLKIKTYSVLAIF